MNGQDRLREEPTIEDARRWFARMPNPLTFVGWKEHIFEAMINHAGDVILPNTNAAQKGYPEYADQTAHFCFFWTPDLAPHWWSLGHGNVIDEGSCRQELLDGYRPVVITHRKCAGIWVRQTVFAHRTGAAELERGDEPYFVWVRFEIEDMVDEILGDIETFAVQVHLANGSALRTSMSKGANVAYNPFEPYPRMLAWSPPYLLEEETDLVRLGLADDGEAVWNPEGCDWHAAWMPTWPYFRDDNVNFLTLPLPPEREAARDVVIPILPVTRDQIDAEMDVGRDAALAETLGFWDEQESRGAAVRIPEPLAESTIRNFPIQVLTAADKNPARAMRLLNMGAHNYEAIWNTPAAMLTAWGLDFLGRHEEAAAYMGLYEYADDLAEPPGEHFAAHEGFLTSPPDLAGIVWVPDHGAVLWAAAQHALLTDDPEFLDRWVPILLKGIDWIRVQRGQTGHPGYEGILPPGRGSDNPQIGQWVWNDGWCYKGLVTVVDLLERIGHAEAAKWRDEADDYRECFQAAVRDAASKESWVDEDGVEWPFVPAELTDPTMAQARHEFYLDCGPTHLAFAGLLDCDDPLIDAALQWLTRGPVGRWFEPEMDFRRPPMLYHELSSCEPCYSWNLLARLLRGERIEFVEGLMSLLAGGQDPDVLSGVETRYGQFAVLFPAPLTICAARRAIVDDELGPDLHLLRMVPRSWLAEGKELSLRDLPTRFGPMSIAVTGRGGGLEIELELPERRTPAGVLLYHPPLAGPLVVEADGQRMTWEGDDPIDLPTSGEWRFAVRPE